MELNVDRKDLLIDKDRDREVDISINNTKKAFSNIAFNVVNTAADYIIKAMPVNDGVKNILLDVKKAFESRDFKTILKTAVGSSMEEGVKMFKMPKNVLSDISKVTNITIKGGLMEGICAAIDIISNKYLKNNLFYNLIKDFINKTKDYIFTKEFKDKLEIKVERLVKKADNFKEKCKEWYKYYDKLDFEKMNDLAQDLKREKRKVISDPECAKESNIIQNILKLVNVKKDKLTNLQLQICNEL